MLVKVGCTHDRLEDEPPIDQAILVRDRDGDAVGRACACAAEELLELGAEYAGPRRRRFLRIPMVLPRFESDIIKDHKVANRERRAAAGLDHAPLYFAKPPKRAPAFGSGRLVARDGLLWVISGEDRTAMAEAARGAERRKQDKKWAIERAERTEAQRELARWADDGGATSW